MYSATPCSSTMRLLRCPLGCPDRSLVIPTSRPSVTMRHATVALPAELWVRGSQVQILSAHARPLGSPEPQHVDGSGIQVDDPGAFPLRRPLDQPLALAIGMHHAHRAADAQSGAVEVDVSPTQCQQ